MDKAIIYDQKRHKLERRAKLFRYIPYLQAAYMAGSMALGNANEGSDFDIIVVAPAGRLYTCRFFTLLVFSLLGWRTDVESRKMKDGFCLNHFITKCDPKLRMHPNDPNGIYSHYARQLEGNLIQLLIRPISPIDPIGPIGRFVEMTLKQWQQRRIRRQISQWHRPEIPSRLVVNDEEVHLCFRLRKLKD